MIGLYLYRNGIIICIQRWSRSHKMYMAVVHMSEGRTLNPLKFQLSLCNLLGSNLRSIWSNWGVGMKVSVIHLVISNVTSCLHTLQTVKFLWEDVEASRGPIMRGTRTRTLTQRSTILLEFFLALVWMDLTRLDVSSLSSIIVNFILFLWIITPVALILRDNEGLKTVRISF